MNTPVEPSGGEGAREKKSAMDAFGSPEVQPVRTFQEAPLPERLAGWVPSKPEANSQTGPEDERVYLSDLMGSGSEIRRVFDEVKLVARTDLTVVIAGESGSGKELIANAIHRLSHRARGPFVPVDCGSIPPTLIESELFGHEKGAFTGADRTRPGRFEAASGGTLFLDEISNLPLPLQAKLLRALQEKQVWRVGGVRCTKVDIRVVVATNQELALLVESGLFRRDFYHRLNEFNIGVPALRDRREDVPFLANRFLDLANLELGKDVSGFSAAALDFLSEHNWSGNVRELRNAVRRAVLLASDCVELAHLGFPAAPNGSGSVADADTSPEAGQPSLREIVKQAVMQAERAALRQVLTKTRGNKAKAARILRVDYKTVHTKVKAYGISV